jgi:hypothetical protein
VTAPNLEAQELALTSRLLTIVNPALTPAEPALRSVFNLIDEAMAQDETPRRLPGVGIIHDDEPWEANTLLSGGYSQPGREHWKLVVLCEAAKRDGGIRGPRGAYTISGLVIDAVTGGWEIAAGCPVRVDRRHRFSPRDSSGELAPIAGYVIEISHPVYHDEE